jgi:hypothetical protein
MEPFMTSLIFSNTSTFLTKIPLLTDRHYYFTKQPSILSSHYLPTYITLLVAITNTHVSYQFSYEFT